MFIRPNQGSLMVNRVIRVGGCKLCFSKLKPVVFQGLAQRSIEHLGKRERIKNTL